MQLAELLKEDLIVLDFKASSKEDAINMFVETFARSGLIEDKQALKNALIEREKLGTTGVGSGIAIPHARTNCVKDLAVAFFRSIDGIDFAAIDNKPVHLIFVLLSPISAGGPYLKLLAKISKLLRNEQFRLSLMSIATPKDVIKIIQENE